MKEKLDRLFNLLAKLLALYQGILELGKQKREVLIAGGKTQELEAITKQEEVLILQVSKVEKVRETVVQEITTANNAGGKQLTLSQIKQLASVDASGRFEQVTENLKTVVNEIASLNEINTRLLQQAINFINFNINMLAQHAADPTYAPQGQGDKPAQARTFFDQKV